MTRLIVALSSSVLSTFIGFCTASTDDRYNLFGKRLYMALAMSPPTIPPMILALAMLSWLDRLGIAQFAEQMSPGFSGSRDVANVYAAGRTCLPICPTPH